MLEPRVHVCTCTSEIKPTSRWRDPAKIATGRDTGIQVLLCVKRLRFELVWHPMRRLAVRFLSRRWRISPEERCSPTASKFCLSLLVLRDSCAHERQEFWNGVNGHFGGRRVETPRSPRSRRRQRPRFYRITPYEGSDAACSNHQWP